MGSCGFHSPVFSDDAAWLPPWLQPNQLPALAKRVKINWADSLPQPEEFALLEENIHHKHDCQSDASICAGYSSLQLHLSGDNTRPDETVPTSDNLTALSLHLSSESFPAAPKILSSQANYESDTGVPKCASVNVPVIVPDQDINDLGQAVVTEQEGNPKQMAAISPSRRKSKQTSHKCRGKFDLHKLQKTSIDEAVELSVSASEAIIITQILQQMGNLDQLPNSAGLEAALSMKEARKKIYMEDDLECYDNPLVDESDETDLLSELDDLEMYSALHDVGLSISQFFSKPLCSNGSSFDSKTSKEQVQDRSCPSLVPETAEISCIRNQEAEGNMHNDICGRQDNVTSDYVAHAEKIESTGRQIVGVSSPCAMEIAAMDYNQILDAGRKDIGFPDLHLGNGEFSGEKVDFCQKIVKEPFLWETSFVSESMDRMKQCQIELRTESRNEMVVPSNASVNCMPISNSSNGFLQSQQDPLTPSEDDPLCSMVPCSVTSSEIPKVNLTNHGNMDNSKNSSTDFKVAAASNLFEEDYPFNPVPRREISDCQIRRTKCNSLKPYSMGIPTLDVLQKSTALCTSIPAANIIKEAGGSHCTGKCDGFCKCYEKESTAGSQGLIDFERNATAAIRQNNSCPPIIFNYKRKRVQVCKVALQVKSVESGNPGAQHAGTIIMESQNGDQNIQDDILQSSNLALPSEGEQVNNQKKVRFAGECKKKTRSNQKPKSNSKRRKRRTVDKLHCFNENQPIFQGLEFLLTGFSRRKEKELGVLIQKYGGYVLSKVPCSSTYMRRKITEIAHVRLPLVLCPKKVPTAKFLYGCAVDSWILTAHWVVDSLKAGTLLPPGRYLTRRNRKSYLTVVEPPCFKNCSYIFDKIGFLLHGNVAFCSKFSNIIKHGGGQIFVSLEELVLCSKDGTTTLGVILIKNEVSASRHLRYCGLEHNIRTMPASWVIDSLFAGRLIPFKKDRCAPFSRIKMPLPPQRESLVASQEI